MAETKPAPGGLGTGTEGDPAAQPLSAGMTTVPAAPTAAASSANAQAAASSVAEAVKRVADAAVAEVRKAAPAGPPSDLRASGSIGGRIVVEGSGFGTNGTLKVNGVQVETTEWSTTRIVGKTPAGARSGEVVVHVDDVTTKRGHITL